MGGRLQDGDMDQLEQWIGAGPQTFSLIHSITRDGCSGPIFHQICDNKGPTVSVMYNPQGSVFGGYTSVSWTSNHGTQVLDTSAFIFTLSFSGKPKPTKFPRTGKGNDVVHFTNCGPVFGPGGNDMIFFTSPLNRQSAGYFALNGRVAAAAAGGGSFDFQGVTGAQINNGNMNAVELEVYAVTPGKRKSSSKMKDTPWRKTPAWNEQTLTELKEDIVNFKPLRDLKVAQARILLVGPVGAGKSSFFNTVNSVFMERLSQRAFSGGAEQSLTTAYTQYQIQVRSSAKLDFRLCDTRGLEEGQGLDVMECSYLLDGHIMDFYEFNPARPISTDHPSFIQQPTMNDKIHCAAFVLDATTLDVIPSGVLQKMKNFQKIMLQKGIPQVILLTKIDKVSEAVAADISKVFMSDIIQETVTKASDVLRIPRSNVFPVKNYEDEYELDDDVNILALLAMRRLLHCVEDRLQNLADRMAVEQRGVQRLNIKD